MAPLQVPEPKKNALAKGAALIHEDEASFRQDSTLHATWSLRGKQPTVPVTGVRKSIKIFGCVEVYTARFNYHRASVFNAITYVDFLERIARTYFPQPVIYIHDNASYHRSELAKDWFYENRKWWQVEPLPPYSPQFNAAEPLWHHVRIKGTHNRYFRKLTELDSTLTSVFRSMQRRPDQIRGYLRPFS